MSELRREMRAAKLHRLCPNETITGWIRRRRLKGSFSQNDYQPLITELVSLIRRLSDFHRRVLFDPVDDYQTIWLPVDNNEYIQFGEHVEGSATSIQGRKVSFTIPISNHYYLRQIKSTCEVTTRTLDLEFLKDLATTGPRLKEIEKLGFLMLDGVLSLIAGNAVVLQVGTVIKVVFDHKVACKWQYGRHAALVEKKSQECRTTSEGVRPGSHGRQSLGRRLADQKVRPGREHQFDIQRQTACRADGRFEEYF
jgi:hypothetical protein